MKRLLSAVALTLLPLSGLAVTGVTAAPAQANESAARGDYAFLYAQQNYGGQQWEKWTKYNSVLSTGTPVNSVINHTGKDLCGFNDRNHGINYRFFKGGAWSYVGSPFSDASPLMWVNWADVNGC
ncbi:hypothetical protein ACIGJO_31155 [Streptomyces sp. NPDC079020]|uniref:hypothetical protein n=1 Tax=Streptomyces sp. NPDC079020 TaxID=3365722 RepID=UPI0037D3EE92